MRWIISFLLIIISFVSHAQVDVKKHAESMGKALTQKDYKKFVTYTYPAILEEMGGSEKMAAAIARQMEGMEKTAEIISLTYGEPSSILVEGKELQCTIPQQMVLQTSQGKIRAKSTLIGISRDEGKSWYFIDAGERDIQTVRVSLPNVSRRLQLPKPEPPQFLEK